MQYCLLIHHFVNVIRATVNVVTVLIGMCAAVNGFVVILTVMCVIVM
jgi:hypothetical protein